ncbi:MAG: aspartate-alanine antiporter [Candidatus Aquilonibacter sp.]
MIAWLVATLQHHAELAIFLSLAIGYFVGPLSLGGFNLGNVTASLLAGVLVGQLNIPVDPPLKAFVFLLFLFAVGYKVGPQFFAGLRRDGIPQIIFALFACLTMLVAATGFAWVVHFNVGEAAGLLAGSVTQSAAIGTASDAIGRLKLDAALTKTLQDQIAVGYAVAYVLATITGVLVCSRLVPWLFRFDLAEECKKLGEQMGLKPGLTPGVFAAYTPNSVRAIRIDGAFSGQTVGQLERGFEAGGQRVFVAAIRRGNEILSATPADALAEGEVIALAGPSEVVIALADGKEVHDPALLDIPILQLDVVVTNPAVSGLTVSELMTGRARGVVLKNIRRGTVDVPVLPLTVIEPGDTLQIAGFLADVEAAAKVVGYALRPSAGADVVFISIAILIGGAIGALSFSLAGIPLGLGTSSGALIAGLIAGYLRSRYPMFGNISPGAQWVFDSFALTVFVAIVGLEAGPSFIGGIKSVGVPLVVGGVLIPLVSLVIAAAFGKFVLRFNNVILCGALAGADTSTASFGAVQDTAKSNLVTLGYTITYAVGNVLLTVWGTVVVAIFSTRTAV